jgi:hypothetical protein
MDSTVVPTSVTPRKLSKEAIEAGKSRYRRAGENIFDMSTGVAPSRGKDMILRELFDSPGRRNKNKQNTPSEEVGAQPEILENAIRRITRVEYQRLSGKSP